ncbi:DMT family transporter [Marinomonas aquiplantarum]|uniref:Threonine/homoserine efflux transporter RhtA n=1 Tax=Marinomonas aquiplantarum TaxID=491951 RepID=A0A366D7X8_9GAMM|nr:DMT family transporter [Marinomonas aquiplantarum]RBO86140.1 threonine/homoserine efflux transporter RhtA [Marinomonas aquiplantarum]
MAGTFFIMIACFTWALDTLIRYPLLGAGYSTLQIVLIEHLTLVIFIAPMLWRYRHVYRHLSLVSLSCLFFIGGVGSAIGTLAFTEAFQYLNPTVVILLQKLQPIVAILLAFWFLKERIEGQFVQWAAVILLGSFVMMWPDLRHLGDAQWHYSNDSVSIIKGYGFTLIAVIAWGAATVCGKYLSHQNVPANAIMSGRFVAGLLVLAPLALVQTETLVSMQISDLGLAILMALLSGFIGMWFYYQGLKTVPAQLATLAELSFPVFAAAINWLFLDMSLTAYQIIGGLMLILGNIGLRMKELRKTELNAVSRSA